MKQTIESYGNSDYIAYWRPSMTDQTPEARLAAALASQDSIEVVERDPTGVRRLVWGQLASHALAADPTLVCPDPDAHEGVTFTVDSLAAAVFAADDPNFRFATRGNCERFATAIIKAAKEASE